MKYAHLGDVHIGSFREPEMSNLSTIAFSKAIDTCIKEKVDFILIAGDLFNTALPEINSLKVVTEKLKELQDNNISCYLVPGSHDFSPTGKTMLDVLESAGLLINVVKGQMTSDNKLQLTFSIDKKTGAKITGMLGKKGGLESEYYKDIDYSNLEKEEGYKIFMFHTTITELKPKDMQNVESNPISILPKGFNYYAGGHVHIVKEAKYGNANIVYPGPTFPANFKELEELQHGGFYIIDTNTINAKTTNAQTINNEKNNNHTNKVETHTNENNKENITGQLTYHKITVFDVISVKIDADNKTPKEVEEDIEEFFKSKDVNRKIILIRVEGELQNGKSTDINFRHITESLEQKNSHYVLRNTTKLISKEFKEVKTDSKENIEEEIIKNNTPQIKIEDFDVEKLVKELMDNSNDERHEGETVFGYEKRIIEKFDKIFKN
ncbi:MAG: metallophosphoesterase [Candidatus Woesearchaeota archaeon]|jgi:hypothetical protein